MSAFLNELAEGFGELCRDLDLTKFLDAMEEESNAEDLISKALEEPKCRTLVYHAFTLILRSYRPSLTTESSRAMFVQGLTWFSKVYPVHPADSPSELVCRMALFTTLKSTTRSCSEKWAASVPIEGMRQRLTEALEYEPLEDMLKSLPIDAEAWLRLHENSAIERFCSPEREEEDESGDETDVESMVERYNLSLLDAEFCAPSRQDESLLEAKFRKSDRRIDAYAVLGIHLGRLAWRARRNSGDGDGGSQVDGSAERARSADAVGGSGKYAKLNWLIPLVTKQFRAHPPNSPLILSFYNQLAQEIPRKLSLSPFSATYDALHQLRNKVLEDLGSKYRHVKMAHEPRIPVEDEEETPIKALLEQSSEEHQESGRLSSSVSLIGKRSSRGVTLAYLNEVWLQVDCIYDRLVMRSGIDHQANTALEDQVLQSVKPGKLVFTESAIQWSGARSVDENEDEEGEQQDEEEEKQPLEPALEIKYSDVVRFHLGTIHNQDLEPDSSNMEDLNLVFFLTVHANREAYKFYPIYRGEMTPLRDILMAMVGRPPFKENEFIMEVLGTKLQITRRQALRQLLYQERPWIENSGDLSRVVGNLTDDLHAQSVYEMERLYHSCRMEPEVAREAVYTLRRCWHNAQSENVRLKLLSVVDRLLDKAVMRSSDSNFQNLYSWLKHLEETVSPYKSVEALKLVVKLAHRARAIQLEPLTPLISNHQSTVFQDWDDYRRWRYFYEHPTS